MRFSSLTFRVTLIFAACTSFLAVSESARSKASLQGAVLVSGGSGFVVPLEPSTVKKQVAPIPAWAALPWESAGVSPGIQFQGYSCLPACGMPNLVSSGKKCGQVRG
jgi:hypothetical protein